MGSRESAQLASAPDARMPDLEAVASLVQDDLRAVDATIRSRLDSPIELIRTLGFYLVSGGGKRVRPLTLLLSARALGYEGPSHVTLAAVLEFIHSATLLHDDVVDASQMRRGRATANEVWGNEAAVLVGDFLYARAFEIMVDADSMRVMEIMSRTTSRIAEGEVMQLMNVGSTDVTEALYMDVIERKTAILFEAAARLGAVLAGADRDVEEALARYGLALGTTFQLVDDLLDYQGESGAIGKNVGDDLAEGKSTLPLIHAIAHGGEAERELITGVLRERGRERTAEVVAAVTATGSLAYTAERARAHAALARGALDAIPDSPYRQGLLDLADFTAERAY